jgi:hypothetical protein
MQQEIGLEGVTDGEFRRGSWHMDLKSVFFQWQGCHSGTARKGLAGEARAPE